MTVDRARALDHAARRRALQHPKEPADLGAGPPPSAREPSPPWRSTGHARTGNHFESTAVALESGCAHTRSRPGIGHAKGTLLRGRTPRPIARKPASDKVESTTPLA